jgi:hypothetical protein
MWGHRVLRKMIISTESTRLETCSAIHKNTRLLQIESMLCFTLDPSQPQMTLLSTAILLSTAELEKGEADSAEKMTSGDDERGV